MRIALVSEHASPLATLGGVDAGGQNVHVAALATALGRAGHDVTVHTRRDDPSLAETVVFAPGVVVRHVDAGPAAAIPKDDLFGFMPEFAAGLQRAWRMERPDVVHSHFWMSGWAARRAADACGVPVVHTYHALGITKRRHQGAKDTSPSERAAVEGELARRADHLVATSSEEIFELVRMGARRSRISLVPCGVDLEHFTPARQAPAGGPRVLVVSRLVERKGIGNVVAALAHVPAARLVVAGGPPHHRLNDDAEARRLGAIAQRVGVADRLDLLGRVDRTDLPALYAAADVVACVPWYEPFGLVALEAMACGRPVVASAVGGLVDTVIDGATGVLVPPREPRAIGRALLRLLSDGTLRRELGLAGVARARARYGWDTVAAETIDAYRLARHATVDARTSVG